MRDGFLVVARTDNVIQAHAMQARLEGEGIESILDDEFTISANPLYNVAVGGAKILVPVRDAARAEAILRAKPPDGGETAADGPPPRCPRCESADLHRPGLSRKASFLSILLLGFPLGFGRKEWRCGACGHAWKV